jgi:hypothetical protein
MPKIFLLGIYSHVFYRNLITGILSYPNLRDCTISQMDVAQEYTQTLTVAENRQGYADYRKMNAGFMPL